MDTHARPLSAGALSVLAPRPAAGPTPAFLQFLPGPAYAPFSGRFLLGILDPADELVASQRRDVRPGIECRGVGDQRLAQVRRQLVHHPTGHSLAAHRPTVGGSCRAWHPAVIVQFRARAARTASRNTCIRLHDHPGRARRVGVMHTATIDARQSRARQFSPDRGARIARSRVSVTREPRTRRSRRRSRSWPA
jgi:hypothetical protein